ncbi:MAG: hypothetical protein V4450_07395 [Bacteroidota bacterium]
MHDEQVTPDKPKKSKRPAQPKTDKLEYEKRIRVVQEWIIEEWPYTDIISQINSKWGIEERQAKRYVAEARKRWVGEENQILDHKRRLKVETLKKLKRSLQEKFKGTPAGIRAVMAVEKEIILLEGIRKPTKVSLTDSEGNDVPLAIPEIKVYNTGPPLARSEDQIS